MGLATARIQLHTIVLSTVSVFISGRMKVQLINLARREGGRGGEGSRGERREIG